jgi:hypothetical protein
MITYNETVNEVYEAILENIKYELEDIVEDGNSKQSDFWDICHQEIDNIVSSNNREDNLKAIDDTGHENTIDDCLVDRNADITMQIAQIAYGCIETELCDDDLFQELQTKLADPIDSEEAKELLDKINDQLD